MRRRLRKCVRGSFNDPLFPTERNQYTCERLEYRFLLSNALGLDVNGGTNQNDTNQNDSTFNDHLITASDWSQLHNSDDLAFVFVKGAQGNFWTDAQTLVSTYAPQAKAAGLAVGVYDYADPINSGIVTTPSDSQILADANNEAQYFLGFAAPYITQGYLQPELDLEAAGSVSGGGFDLPVTVNGTSYPNGILNNASLTWNYTEVAKWVVDWVAAIKQGLPQSVQVNPILYMDQSFAQGLQGVSPSLVNYPLWIADPTGNANTTPTVAPWSTWAFMQYNQNGSLSPPINGMVLLDEFNGTAPSLASFEIQSATEPSIAGAEPSPSSISAGGSTTVSYSISAPANSSYLLGASLQPSSGSDIDLSYAGPATVNLQAGTNSFSRTYTVPQTTAAGTYGLITALWQDTNGDGIIDAGDTEVVSQVFTDAITVTPATNTRIISLAGNLTFGNVVVGSTAQTSFTIYNNGNSPLDISSITYPTGFSGNWSGGDIGPDGLQDVTVTFTPTTTTSYGPSITVNSDATNSGGNTLPISGTGIAATRILSLAGNLTFGSVAVGSSAQNTLTIYNQGNSPLTVSNIGYPTGFSANWSGTIPAASSEIVTVTFSPPTPGDYSGQNLIVYSDQTNSGGNTIAVSGTGTAGNAASLSLLTSFNGNDGDDPQSGLTSDSQGNLYGTTYSGGPGWNPPSNYAYGTVFEIAAGTNTITTLASFNGSNGKWPSGGLAVDSAGNVYGTTFSGGANSDGSIFEVAKGSGSITTLASFNGTNGDYPYGNLVLVSGNLYGTTSGGGANGGGTLFELPKSGGTINVVASFNGSIGLNPYTGLTADSGGNLYGATSSSGPNGYGTVFELASGSSTITPLASFPGSGPANPKAALLVDASGNIFGTTYYGGTNNKGSVFEVAIGSGTVTTLGSFSGSNGEDPFGGPLLVDAAGDLYGAAAGGTGSAADGAIFEVVKGSGVITAVTSFNGSNGEGPIAIVPEGNGYLYGVTSGGGAYNWNPSQGYYGDGALFSLQVSAFGPQLVFSQSPGSVTAGSTISPAVKITVENFNGSVLTGDTSSVTLSIASGPSSSLGGTLTEPFVNGVATFNNLAINTVGSYTLLASDAADGISLISGTFMVNAPAAPAAPDLLAATDSGSSSTDNLTKYNNSTSSTALQFLVGSTVSGSTVTIYADGVAIGSAVSTGTTTTVTTNGSYPLADGSHTITARQTPSGGSQSADSSPLTITIDTQAPSVTNAALIDNVTSRSLSFTFSENASTSLSAGAVSFINMVAGGSLGTTGYSYNSGTNTATFSLQSSISNGIYLAILPGADVVDAAGNALASNCVFEFALVNSGTTFALPASGQNYMIQQLSVESGGTLNLSNDELTIQYSNGNSPASSIAALLATGFAAGKWTGTGIISSKAAADSSNSTGVGYFDNGVQVVIGPTWYGDANLDGVINADDLSLMLVGQALGRTRWQDGDFLYHNTTNADDWMKFAYALAVSKGQSISSSVIASSQAGNTAAMVTTPLPKNATAVFAQLPIAPDDYLDDLLNSPQTIL